MAAASATMPATRRRRSNPDPVLLSGAPIAEAVGFLQVIPVRPPLYTRPGPGRRSAPRRSHATGRVRRDRTFLQAAAMPRLRRSPPTSSRSVAHSGYLPQPTGFGHASRDRPVRQVREQLLWRTVGEGPQPPALVARSRTRGVVPSRPQPPEGQRWRPAPAQPMAPERLPRDRHSLVPLPAQRMPRSTLQGLRPQGSKQAVKAKSSTG